MTGPSLVWAHTLLVWALSTYVSRDPLDDEMKLVARWWPIWVVTRSVIAAAVVAWLSGSVWLPVLVLALGIVLPFARAKIPARYCAELEIGTNITFAAAAFLLIRRSSLEMQRAVISLPFSEQRIAAACLVAALMLFTVHGGTYLVRGVLKKSGAIPRVPSGKDEGDVDVKEFNRGRLIGALERVLLFAVVIAGSFEELGFIVAAKGLIRSREFELSRDMTEYFLIGSLTSVLVALATGWLAQLLIRAYW
jgi:hypothetical protein